MNNKVRPIKMILLPCTVLALFLVFLKYAPQKHTVDQKKDYTVPVITLTGEENVTLQYGEIYLEEGYTAIDDVDGDITSKVVSNQSDNEIVYTVTDSAGNYATKKRIINYTDNIPPTINIKGESYITLEYGEEYIEQGVEFSDNITSLALLETSLKIENQVDSTIPGEYEIVYTISDEFKNESSVTRYVIVNEKKEEIKEEIEKPIVTNDTVYLTFDDGPGAYTDYLLDILLEKNVKATFFVTKSIEQYPDTVRRMIAEGHTVALHSYTHDYASIYSSEDAYLSDLNTLSEKLYDIAGIRPNIIRFPGGSSNMVSTSYCYGIMSALTVDIETQGYQYFDWNVDSQDASGNLLTKEQIAQNVIEGVRQNYNSVVLQHDIKENSVYAVEQIITTLQEEGYTFDNLKDNSPVCHHGVNN